MSNSFLHQCRSNPATQFTEALLVNAASIVYNVALPPVSARRFLVRALKVVTKENYGPEINFFGNASGPTTDPATDTAIARFGFLNSMGEQLGGAGLWRYYIDGLAIPYVDADWLVAAGSGGQPPAPPSLHLVLQNIGANTKSAGSNGSTKVLVFVEPMQGW